jgi:signal recognition particle subunit SRP68
VETLIYVYTLSGKLSLKRDDFTTTLTTLSTAHHLLDMMRTNSSSSRDQALANVFIDEISPEIRYSAHELKRGRSHDVQQIVEELKPKIISSIENYRGLLNDLQSENAKISSDESKLQLSHWMWDGQEVPIRIPELVDALLKVQKADGRGTSSQDKSNKARMARFDALLQAWTETEEISRRAYEAQKVGYLAFKVAACDTKVLTWTLAEHQRQYAFCGQHPRRAIYS